MKNYLSLLTATLFVGLVACNGESSNDQVEQKIDKEPALILSGSTPDSISQVYLYQVIDDALELTDSAIVAANSFVFKEKKLTPQMVYLTLSVNES